MRLLRVASGADRSLGGRVSRGLLVPICGAYGMAVAVRGALYRRGVLKRASVERAVISVGNITVGGTGKTPLVVYLARLALSKGLKPAVLARGYRPISPSGMNDEGLLLQRVLPEAAVLCGRDRVEAARRAISQGAEVLILDDGFQHLRLNRELDVVTVDATFPFGGGRLLPAGLLREPISALGRADVIVLTRTDQVPERKVEETLRKISAVAPKAEVVKSVHRVISVVHLGGGEMPVSTLSSKRVAAFCGIGNAEAFRRTVGAISGELVLFREFRDHHVYEGEELVELSEAAKRAAAEMLVTTEKDSVRLPRELDVGLPVGVVRTELVITEGEDRLVEAVMATVDRER